MSASAVAQDEQINLVVVGHVDHGKSTVIGRLLADTGSLPDGKLEQVKDMCKRNARPFEYAFLLDALKNEQAQGITIDTARSFFKTDKRHYIINDAPGHIEFLKNMVTGAARADAAVLVIDAQEGIRENSKRHGYMISMVGVKQVVVLVNKMDLVNYDEAVFSKIEREYTKFLTALDVTPIRFIPVSAREGMNIATRGAAMPWYDGLTLLEQVDDFAQPSGRTEDLFRMPVQDIYKFTQQGDDRRIVAGLVETGTVHAGDEVVFHPSGKRSTIKTIECFNAPCPDSIGAGYSTGVTLTEQIYIRPGELMTRADEAQPHVNARFRANLFWMGRQSMLKGRQYKLKLGAARVTAELAEVLNVLDASELTTDKTKDRIDRHDVAECVIEMTRPLAFDLRNEVESTGRFVIVDNHEIAGCGVILEEMETETSLLEKEIHRREIQWEPGYVTAGDRTARHNHTGKFIVFVGPKDAGKRELAKQLELKLFSRMCHAYYLGIDNVFGDLAATTNATVVTHDQHVQQLGEIARIMTGSGVLFITTLTDVDEHDLERLKLLNAPHELFVVGVGMEQYDDFKVDVSFPQEPDSSDALETIIDALSAQKIFLEYYI